MATDISPVLLERIEKDFAELTASSAKVRSFTRKLETGTATQLDVQMYSSELGRLLGKVFKLNFHEGVLPNDTLYWNIAKAVVEPMIRQNHSLVTQSAQTVQMVIDRASNIGLNAIVPDIDEARVKGLLDLACAEGLELSEIQNRLDEPVRNITESFFDDFIATNAALRSSVGLNVVVTRRLGGKACEWCQSLEGVYNYNNLPDDIYRRHERCRCTVTFDNSKIKQDVWSKRTF